VREAVAITASLMLGAGLGLLLGDYALSMGSGVPVVVQPLAIALAWPLALTGGSHRRHWGVALAVALASSMTALGIRVAATALELARASSGAELLPFPYPRSMTDRSALLLVGLSLAVTSGYALLLDSLTRFLSPLWVGLESLRPSVEAPQSAKIRTLLIGAPLGVTSAWIEVGVGALGHFPYAFTLLYMCTLPVATSLTASLHLLLHRALSSLASSDFLLSVRVGVQAGLVVSTLASALLLYVRGGASLYPGMVPALLVGMAGLLSAVTGYIVLRPQYAVYLLALTTANLVLAMLVAIRLEGGALLPLYPTQPPVPELLQLAWILTTSFGRGWIGVEGAEQLLRLLASPYLLLPLAAVSLWECRAVPEARGSAILLVTLSAPPLLIVARAAVMEGYAAPSRLVQWSLPEVDANLARIDPWVASIAAILSFATTFIYYAPPPRLGFIRLLLDLNGLMFAYGLGGVILGSGSLTADLFPILLALFSALRALTSRSQFYHRVVKGAVHGAVLSYGLGVLAMLLATSLSE